MAVYLGIDIGTSGAKTLAINDKGGILASAMETYPCYVPRPLWSEQDPEDWWQATIRSVRRVMSQARLKPGDVKAIGLSGQMHGSVFLDNRDKVIRRAILWNDQRTAAECAEIERRAGGRAKLIRMVANPALTGFTAPKILWLRNHEPKHFDKTRKILLPKDEIRRRLTGEYATEVSDASGMLLLDVATRKWSKELLSALELDIDLFGVCYESEEVTGKLRPAAAKTFGLTTDCLVVGGAGDCAAGAVGNGIVNRGVLSTSIGTSGVVFVHSDEMKIDPQGRVHTFCHAVHGKWHMMGVNLSAGGSLEWFRNELCKADAAVAKKAKKEIYDLLTEEAQKAPPGSEGLFFLPYLSGERTPHADPDARGCFVGLTLAHGRGHLIRAIMEGVAYSMRESLEIFVKLGVPIKQIRASGGGAQPAVAANPGRYVRAQGGYHQQRRRSGLRRGFAGGRGAGAFKDVREACAAVIRVVSETSTDSPTKKYYDKAFPVYQQLYRSLKNDFQSIAALEK